MKTKLAGHLPLQDAIARTIEEAREKMKLASDACEGDEKEKVKKLVKFEKKEHGHIPSEKEEKAEYEKKSSIIDTEDPEEVEKLASSLDFLAEKIAGDSVTIGGESRQGGQVLATMNAVGGTQPYKKDSSKSHNVPTSTGMKATKDNPGAATAVPTDDERAPGGTGAKYPAKGVLKTGSVARLQLALAAQTGVAPVEEDEEKTAGRVGDAAGKVKDFFKGRPKAWGEAKRGVTEAFTGKGSMGTGAMTKMDRLKSLGFAAKKVAPELGAAGAAAAGGAYALHRRKKNKGKKKTSGAIPGEQVHRIRLGGSEHANEERGKQKGRQYGAAIGTGLGGGAGSGAAGFLAHKALKGISKAREAGGGKPLSGLVRHGGTAGAALAAGAVGAGLGGLLGRGVGGSIGRSVGVMKGPGKEGAEKSKKSSAEAVDYILAKISAVENGGESPQGGEQLSNTAPVPSNPGRNLIRNAQGIKDVTKREAKAPRKKELAEVLTEPAMSAAHDSKVNENLRNAAKGGVKIAAARAFLQKVAAEGCQCDGAGECRYCQMQEKAAALRGNGAEAVASEA